MKELIILIVMFFPDPSHLGEDSVSVTSYRGKPLVFTNVDDCQEWIWKDLDNLKAFGKSVYPEAVAVKEIMCVYKKKEV